MRIVGILLAAGAGVRFGGGKLLATLDDGSQVGVRACTTLASVLDDVIAVVRPGDEALAATLTGAGARVSVCEASIDGMGASVAHGISVADRCDAVVVALGDMPWVSASTITAITAALDEGSSVVVPRYRGRRGNPVGFGHQQFAALKQLAGDRGARDLIDAAPTVCWIDVDDPAIVRDVDTPDDLNAGHAERLLPPT